MSTIEQYRAKAIEYRKMRDIADDPNAAREFQRLEQVFTELADNAQWMVDNQAKIIRAPEPATALFTPDSAAQSSS